jgi:hypothetical protein
MEETKPKKAVREYIPGYPAYERRWRWVSPEKANPKLKYPDEYKH